MSCSRRHKDKHIYRCAPQSGTVGIRVCFVGQFPAGTWLAMALCEERIHIPSVSLPTQEVVRTLGGARGECIGRIRSALGEGGVHAASYTGAGSVLMHRGGPGRVSDPARCEASMGAEGGALGLTECPPKTLDRKGGGRLAEYNQHISNNLFDFFFNGLIEYPFGSPQTSFLDRFRYCCCRIRHVCRRLICRPTPAENSQIVRSS